MKRTPHETEEHFQARKREERARYYGGVRYTPRPWNDDETAMVMSGKYTDRELSPKIHRTVKAIQHQRARVLGKER